MKKSKYSTLLKLVSCAIALNVTLQSSYASEDSYFEQKDQSFWVLKNKSAFTEAAHALIDDEGNWKGLPPVPEYVKFCEPLTVSDIPLLERWLSLKELKCFGIADETRQPNLNLILSWYQSLEESGVDLKKRNLFKLAWLDAKTTLREVEVGEGSMLPAEWVETNRAYQMKDSHYTIIETH